MSSFKKGRNSDNSPRGNSRERYKAGRSFSKNKSYREKGNTEAQYDDKPKRKFSGEKKSFDKPYKKPSDKPYKKSSDRASSFRSEKPKRNFSDEKKSVDKPYKKTFDRERSFDRDDKPKRKFSDSDRKKSFDDKPSFRDEKLKRKFSDDGERKPYREKREDFSGKRLSDDKGKNFRSEKRDDFKSKKFSSDERKTYDKPRTKKFDKNESEDFSQKRVKYDEFEEGKAFKPHEKRDDFKHKTSSSQKNNDEGLIRLNKYLSNAGVASRREADNLILSGAVKVNGVVVNQLGAKISPNDKVSYGDESVKSERKVYLLLNKPKDYITTVDDPQERRTVMELIKGACRERVYPVGRLDRNTTGLLLFTNDGELTTKLTHPKFGIKKVYHVTLNKGLKTDDFKAMIEGVELEDGIIKADDLAFVGEGKKEIGIEIHSGRNRIVRRLFEHLGYDVIKLDRVTFAGLSKKDLPRGKYRFLTQKEVSFLKMIS